MCGYQEEQKFQYNAKEKLDEFGLYWNDHGARNLDLQTGRWTSVDPLAEKYSNTSCYVFVLNRPINAVDPDGRVVIFINGYHGFPSVAHSGGSKAHWGGAWVDKVLGHIGDSRAKYYDGSYGGPKGVLSRTDVGIDFSEILPAPFNLVNPPSHSFIPGARMYEGFLVGKSEAASIVNNLERDSEGNISESIKFITSSTGTAFQRGFSEAICEYVTKENQAIDSHNKSLARNQDGSYASPADVKKRLNVNIEFTVDLDPFQGSQVGPDKNAKANYHMLSNDWIGSLFLGSGIEGSKHIKTAPSGIPAMSGHHPNHAEYDAIPRGFQNPKKALKD